MYVIDMFGHSFEFPVPLTVNATHSRSTLQIFMAVYVSALKVVYARLLIIYRCGIPWQTAFERLFLSRGICQFLSNLLLKHNITAGVFRQKQHLNVK